MQVKGIESWGIQSIRAMLQEKLNALPGPWLLFIDNVWSDEMIYKSPRPSNTRPCKFLITSRFDLMLDQPELIRIKIGEETNCFSAAKLLMIQQKRNFLLVVRYDQKTLMKV